MPSSESRKILIVAAEASSCLYAQRLLQYWKQNGLEVEAFGIGDEAMAAEGFEILARAEDMAVVGVQEVLSHWGTIKKAFYDLIAAVEKKKPQVALLLDYPGFNLRLAKKLKSMNIPVAYYISPQVWAWKQGRVKTIRQVVDKMMVIFPFEKPFYATHGMDVEFVGHPLLDELDPKFFNPSSRAMHRAKYGIREEDTVLALMPGSRNSELKHHLQIQLETARQLHLKYPNLKLMLFTAPNFSKEQMQARLDSLDFPLILIKDEPFSMIDLADVVLCASGTATLMVGLLEKPMVIMYRMGGISAFLAKRFVTKTKFFGLINLVLDKLVVPELFQEQSDVPHLVSELEKLLINPGERKEIAKRLSEAKDRLGNQGATSRVAQVLNSYWSNEPRA